MSNPNLQLTDDAIHAILVSREEEEGLPFLRLAISDNFEHSLNFGPREPGDILLTFGDVAMVLDPRTAMRADGVKIDFKEKDGEEGFKIDNPNGKKGEVVQKSGQAIPLPDVAPPEVSMTDVAYEQFSTAIDAENEANGEGHTVRMTAKRMGSTKANYELNILEPGEKVDGDLAIEVRGLPFVVDPRSSRLLNGVTIDFVDGEFGAGFKFENPKLKEGWGNPVADKIQEIIDAEINPGLGAHGGYVELLDVQGAAAFVLMGGGCQGCGMAAVTLQEGITERLLSAIPEIERIVDTTDHASGTNPYYKS
ncbi:MAG: hypothetical protein GY822_07680 [Deltaproteobacteria bacterium]|nr:hypothetical protein [Deltaproteobacteria bacterium]